MRKDELSNDEMRLLELLSEPDGVERFKNALQELGLLSSYLQAMSSTTL